MLFLKVLTICSGSIALMFSVMLFLYFIKSPQAIGKAVAYMLLAESFGLLVVVLFSLGLLGPMNFITPPIAMGMRWSMFIAAATSSLHLAYQTRLVELKMTNNKRDDD